MGNIYSDFTSTNINQTQMSSLSETCNQTASGSIDGLNITAIDSHIGDITLTNTVAVTDMNCVMTAFAENAVASQTKNTSDSTIKQMFPFQLNVNAQDVENLTDVNSYQQSIVDQACTQSVAGVVENVNFTFIDSTSGNITVANSVAVQGFSCNLQASSYQSAAASVSNASKGSISAGCCSFDLGLIIPVLLGFAGMVAISKFAGKSQGGGGMTSAGVSESQTNAALITSLSQIAAQRPPTGPRTSSMGAGIVVV